MNSTRVLGITGGIGAGKSVVARLLRHLQVPTFDCDACGKQAYTNSLDVREAVISLLGADSYMLSGEPNLSHIARTVFGSELLLSSLEKIIHPYVRMQFVSWKETICAPLGWVGLESAILIPKGFDALCDAVLYVDAPIDIRLARVMRRDSVTARQVQDRMEHQQFTIDGYKIKPIYRLQNTPNSPLIPVVDQVLRKLQSL